MGVFAYYSVSNVQIIKKKKRKKVGEPWSSYQKTGLNGNGVGKAQHSLVSSTDFITPPPPPHCQLRERLIKTMSSVEVTL